MDTITNGVARIFKGNAAAVGTVFHVEPSLRTFQLVLQGLIPGGQVSGTVNIEGSNDGVNFVAIATIDIANGVDGTSSATEGFVSNAPWAYIRANVKAVIGTASIYLGL